MARPYELVSVSMESGYRHENRAGFDPTRIVFDRSNVRVLKFGRIESQRVSEQLGEKHQAGSR